MQLHISRTNVLKILRLLIWLMVSSCQAFQYSRAWRPPPTTNLHRLSGNKITRKFQGSKAFNGSFRQTAPHDSLVSLCKSNDPFDGNSEVDLPAPISSLSDVSHRFQKHSSMSWSSFAYGVFYLWRNIGPLMLWCVVIPSILFKDRLGFVLDFLEHSNELFHAKIIRVFGSVLFHGASAQRKVMRTIGFLPIWLFSPRYNWQRNNIYLSLICAPILEEIVYRWMLWHLWRWIQNAGRKMQPDSRSKLECQSTERQSRHMSLIEHKYSFRIVSSLIFGFGHVGQHKPLWQSNEMKLQQLFVTTGTFRVVLTFLSSFFCDSPLFETRGVVASIGAHAAWNVLAMLGILGSTLVQDMVLGWAFWIYCDNIRNGWSVVLHELTPSQPSRGDVDEGSE